LSRFKKFTTDKIWVVTGAGKGLGRELALLAARNHGIVWALDRDEVALASLLEDAKRNGWDIFTQKLDVTDSEQATSVLDAIVRSSKRVDVWINNAGIQRVGSFLGMKSSDFDLVMDVNFNSVVQLTRKVLAQMDQQGCGVILNMASAAGHVPSPFMSAYVAAKHAVVGFSKSLQAELTISKSPVRVAFASPGFVDTAIIERGKDQGFPEWLSWMLSRPEECASEILMKLAKGENEIYPTLSGKLLRKAYTVAPLTTVRGSKLLLTKGLKDFLLNRYQVPR
jgi:short-subunit dehydrogenase